MCVCECVCVCVCVCLNIKSDYSLFVIYLFIFGIMFTTISWSAGQFEKKYYRQQLMFISDITVHTTAFVTLGF